MKLDIGSGITKIKGYKRVDIDPRVKPDYRFNVEKDHWPFKDNSIEEIRASNLLEHLRDIDFFFEEVHRVLKPGAKIKILVPHYQSTHAFSDPDHIRWFTPETFQYWSRTLIGSDGRSVIRGKMDFDLVKLEVRIDSKTREAFENFAALAELVIDYCWHKQSWIYAELKAVKPLRRPRIIKSRINRAEKL